MMQCNKNLHYITAPFLSDLSLDEVFLLVGRICSEGEKGWITWHASLKKEVFAFLVFGIFSGDLMVTNPAAAVRSVIKAEKPCRYLLPLIHKLFMLI